MTGPFLIYDYLVTDATGLDDQPPARCVHSLADHAAFTAAVAAIAVGVGAVMPAIRRANTSPEWTDLDAYASRPRPAIELRRCRHCSEDRRRNAANQK